MAIKILAINGSYRRGGIIDQAVEAACAGARAAGAETSTVFLSEKPVEFCLNCRSCTQEPGEKRGACVQDDGMAGLLDLAEGADGLIIAAPVNFFNVTAVTRRFMERLVPYAYWPWGAKTPAMRLKKQAKKAVLITSSAMPSLLGRAATGALRALKGIAGTFGAASAGTLYIGLAATEEKQRLPAWDASLAEKLGRKLGSGA
ncbi:MAG: flavodoxin family protein [Elusimicrobiota bacterium]|nr:flavodoxin family protein [Elusimicrobiota bacterium]